MKQLMKKFNRLLALERQRSEMLKDIEEDIGFDISFSDEQIFKNAMATFEVELNKHIAEEISSWMR